MITLTILIIMAITIASIIGIFGTTLLAVFIDPIICVLIIWGVVTLIRI